MKSTMLLALAASAAITASAASTINIIGTVWTVDTMAYEKVGPGTTHTFLMLQSTANSANKLQVHYLTVDKSTPGVKFRAVKAKDKVAGTEQTSAMAKRKSTGNNLYFAGCNGDFYATSGTATNGSSKVGMPTTSCTVDGEIIKTSNSNQQFIIDEAGQALIGRINYYTGTATLGDKVTLFKGVNVGSPANGVTIYTPKYFGSTNQTDYTDNSYEVTARLVDGDQMVCGGKFRLEVTSEPNTSGDTPIPADGFVIFGRGTSKTGCNTAAKTFVGALKVGDIVEFDHVPLLDDNRIKPLQIVSGNPKTVGGGLTLDTEGERTDASAQHPRTGIGYSVTGDSIIMMVVEGRLNGSVGVRTSQLADIMRYAGAWEAINLDGGGSSTLYSSALGVLNRCSDGSERSVGNAIFATIETDKTDKTVTEIRFVDWAPRLPRYGTYTPRIMGFNKDGVMVTDSLTTYTLTCAPEFGTVTADGKSVYVEGEGSAALTATIDGVSATVAATVDNDCRFGARSASILTDDTRAYTIQLMANNGLRDIPVDPSVLSWSSADVAVATVDEQGVIRGVANGQTTITGTIGDQTVEIAVTVEVARSERDNILADFNPEAWKFTKTGCDASTTLTPTATGVKFDYKVSSTRSLSLSLNPVETYHFWSLPTAIEYEVNPASLGLRNINIKLEDALGHRVSLSTDEIPANSPAKGVISFSPDIDTDDVAAYPLRLISINFNPSASAGESGSLDVTALNAIYPGAPSVGVEAVPAAPSAATPAVTYDLRGIRVDPSSAGIRLTTDGRKLLQR